MGQGNQQVIDKLQQAAREVQAKEQRKAEFFRQYPHLNEAQFQRYEKLREQQEHKEQRQQQRPDQQHRQGKGFGL